VRAAAAREPRDDFDGRLARAMMIQLIRTSAVKAVTAAAAIRWVRPIRVCRHLSPGKRKDLRSHGSRTGRMRL
jgi:hypothetical protein